MFSCTVQLLQSDLVVFQIVAACIERCFDTSCDFEGLTHYVSEFVRMQGNRATSTLCRVQQQPTHGLRHHSSRGPLCSPPTGLLGHRQSLDGHSGDAVLLCSPSVVSQAWKPTSERRIQFKRDR